SSVSAFVTAYNELFGTLKYQTGYNPTTKTGGPLVGDATARNVQTGLRKMFSSEPDGLNGNLKNLNQVGISFQSDGTLALDASKLKKAITDFPDDIGRLFATAGTATDSLVKFTDSKAATQSGDYALSITQLATQGTLRGSAAAATSIQAGVNDKLSLTIDGIS